MPALSSRSKSLRIDSPILLFVFIPITPRVSSASRLLHIIPLLVHSLILSVDTLSCFDRMFFSIVSQTQSFLHSFFAFRCCLFERDTIAFVRRNKQVARSTYSEERKKLSLIVSHSPLSPNTLTLILAVVSERSALSRGLGFRHFVKKNLTAQVVLFLSTSLLQPDRSILQNYHAPPDEMTV